MAKIDIAKKKKEEKENKPVIALYASADELFQAAAEKMKLGEIIVQHQYKIDNYLLAAAMFDEAGEIPGAKEMADTCRKLVKETKQDEARYRYETAIRRETFYDQGKEKLHEASWYKLRDEFAALGDMKDAKAHAAFCAQKAAKCKRRSNRTRGVVLAVIILLVAGAAVSYATDFSRYVMGRTYMLLDKYSAAKYNFEKCPNLLDSNELVQKCEQFLLEQPEDTMLEDDNG